MPHNLLTFAPADRDAAERLNAQFRQWNLDTELPPDSFSREAVEDCESLVLLVSGQTSASDRVRIELAWALQAKKRILPILIEKTSLLPFPFLVERQDIDYTADPVTVMKRITSTLKGTLPYPMEPPELPPRSNNTLSDQEIIAVDEEMAAALFFAAAELTENTVEEAIFLYNTLLRYAPDYAGGSLNRFMSLELGRLQPMWLQNLKEGVFEAVKHNNLLHAGHLVREMQVLDAGAAATQAASDHFGQAQIDRLTVQVKEAMKQREWDKVEALIQAVGRLNVKQSETLGAEVHRERILSLEETTQAAIHAGRWDEAERTIAEIGGLDANRSDDLRQKLDEALVTSLEDSAREAVRQKRWDEAEQIIKNLGGLDANRSNTLQNQFQEAKFELQYELAKSAIEHKRWDALENYLNDLTPHDGASLELHKRYRLILGALGLALVDAKQIETARELAARLRELDPENNDVSLILVRAMKVQIEPILSKGRFALSSGQWQTALDTAHEALEQAPDDDEALAIQRTAQTWMTADALYEQAVRAVESDQMTVAGVLLRRIQEMRPEYGDPEGILRGQPLSTAFAGFAGLTARLEAHPSALNALAIASDGSCLVTASESLAMVWELPTFEPIHAFKDPEWVKDVALSPNNDYLAVISTNREMRVWSLADGKMVLQNKMGVNKAAFSPDGKNLVATTVTGQSSLLSWSMVNLSPTGVWFDTYTQINTMAFSPDGHHLAMAFEDGNITLYDVREILRQRKNSESYLDGRPPAKTRKWQASSLVFLNEGEYLLSASGTDNESVAIWDMDGVIVRSFRTTNYSASSIAVSPDGSLLATAGRLGGAIGLWDLQTGKLLNRIRNDGRSVPGMVFTPDGLYLLIGDSNGNVAFWGVGGAENPVVHKGKRG